MRFLANALVRQLSSDCAKLICLSMSGSNLDQGNRFYFINCIYCNYTNRVQSCLTNHFSLEVCAISAPSLQTPLVVILSFLPYELTNSRRILHLVTQTACPRIQRRSPNSRESAALTRQNDRAVERPDSSSTDLSVHSLKTRTDTNTWTKKHTP